MWKASWGRLGSILDPSWGPLGASWVLLGRHVGIMGASWKYLEYDLHAKMDSISACYLGHHFVINLGWILPPKIDARIMKNHVILLEK